MGNSQEPPEQKRLSMSYFVLGFDLSALRVYLSYATLNTESNPLLSLNGRFRPKE